MVDPLSVSAVAGFLRLVCSRTASESGRRLGEAVGAMVSRVLGLEVQVPAGEEERDRLARVLVAEAGRDPAGARVLASWMSAAPSGLSGGAAVPRMLPGSVRFFTDRKEGLASLDREAFRKGDGRPKVALIHGPEGIGSSELALFWGGSRADRFPDGTLYADLGGSAATAPSAAQLAASFLIRLGVPADAVPQGVEDRLDALRGLMRGARLLVVLDHVRSAAQVRPLLTAEPGVFTVATSRHLLVGLDALPVPVGPLPERDARRLLTDVAGKQAVAAARATLPSVLRRCAGSPFALRAAAAHLTDPPGRAPGPRGADGPGGPLRTAVEELYGRLDPDRARVYRLCSLRPWPALSAGPVAAAAQLGEGRAAEILAELAGLRLLEALPDGRFRFRPAVRAHAEDAALREEGLAACAAATGRVIDWFVRFAVRADFAALPQRWHVGPLFDELGPGDYEDEGAAVAALVAELGNLVEAVVAAEEFGDLDAACQGTEALWAVQLKAGVHERLLPALRAGTRAAGRSCPGTETSGRLHTQLALALMESPDSWDEARRELAEAARNEEAAGHPRGRATAVETVGLLELRMWRFRQAWERFEEADALLDGIGPGDRGADDLPRARALLQRHRGRALRGLGRFDEGRERLGRALEFFRRTAPEPYNEARVLTDLAELELLAGDPQEALRLADRAAVPLRAQHAVVHLRYLDDLRQRCLAQCAGGTTAVEEP